MLFIAIRLSHINVFLFYKYINVIYVKIISDILFSAFGILLLKFQFNPQNIFLPLLISRAC